MAVPGGAFSAVLRRSQDSTSRSKKHRQTDGSAVEAYRRTDSSPPGIQQVAPSGKPPTLLRLWCLRSYVFIYLSTFFLLLRLQK